MTGTLVIPASALASDCCSSAVPDPTAPDTTIVTNDGWLPDIALAHFRTAARVTDTVTVPRQREAILSAMIRVGDDLAAWIADRQRAGAATLATVVDQPNPQLGGEPRLVILYRQAVYAEAKAVLVERLRDIDTTTAGQRNVDALDPSIGELRRDRTHAVRAILQRTPTCVELI